MRKVLQLIRRFWNLILFIILEVTCFALISKHNNVQGVDIVNSSNAVVGYIYKKQNDVTYYFRLKAANDSLLKENARLRNEMGLSSNVDTFADSLVKIAVREKVDTAIKVQDTSNIKKPIGKATVVRYAEYQYIPARVINNSISNDRKNYITINRGSNAGVGKNMMVVTGNGIVGRVENVSPNFATVVTILSEQRKYSAKLPDGTGGFINWEKGSPDFVDLTQIPIQQKLKKGDSVFTSSYSDFPENILVGMVAKIDTLKVNNTLKVKVRLSTNFRNLQYVYVVKNALGDEKQKLEATENK